MSVTQSPNFNNGSGPGKKAVHVKVSNWRPLCLSYALVYRSGKPVEEPPTRDCWPVAALVVRLEILMAAAYET